ncbi:hypothetical protein Q0812_11245 [Brevundimonas sp. 2R-24]|uniref:Uncharacterized protein n=1 Tax=Peiella sedimenti TaxID=3061083 RepID=A0ABT8SNC5_9CAUL|nr:hypothetical protein [Caulobacteraceae bacterium XZ-24]
MTAQATVIQAFGRTAPRRRLAAAVAVVIAAHALVFWALGLVRPAFPPPVDTIIDVFIAPPLARRPPSPAATSQAPRAAVQRPTDASPTPDVSTSPFAAAETAPPAGAAPAVAPPQPRQNFPESWRSRCGLAPEVRVLTPSQRADCERVILGAVSGEPPRGGGGGSAAYRRQLEAEGAAALARYEYMRAPARAGGANTRSYDGPGSNFGMGQMSDMIIPMATTGGGQGTRRPDPNQPRRE